MGYIEIKDLTKIIKGKVILDNINLSLDKGKIHGFVGHNGSGKTMLFKSIIGLISPTQGTITVDSKKIDPGKPYPLSLGVMIENNNLWSYLSAYENLKELASIKKQIGRDEIKAYIEKVGLDPNSKKPYSKFSLGMKQRLILAQAIMESPELLILDEPTNALDADGIVLFKEIVKEQKERGATILISSHSMEDFDILCDEIIRIDNGKIINK